MERPDLRTARRVRADGHVIWLFAGSQRGGNAAATASTLNETAKLNGIDAKAWLTSVLGRTGDHKITRIYELLPSRYAATAA